MKNADFNALEERYRHQLEQVPQGTPVPALPRQTIHYTELPEDTSDSLLAREWNFYRREVGRLLAEGHESRWVLIKGEAIVSVWDSRAEAKAAALGRYFLQHVFLHQVLTRETVLRTPFWWHQCHS
jgi:hypothetical protein